MRHELQQFTANTLRTWRDQGKELNLEHAFLGLGDELGEIKGAYKKNIGYGRPLDLTNILEESGDFLYFFVRAFSEMDEIRHVPIQAFDVPGDKKYRLQALNDITKQIARAEYLALWGLDEEEACYRLSLAFARFLGFISSFGFTLQQVMDANEQKLQARYPEKWTEDAAINRDTEAERVVLQKHIHEPNLTINRDSAALPNG